MTQESNQFSFRKIYTGKIRGLLDDSFLIKATIKIPNDMGRNIVTKGNIR